MEFREARTRVCEVALMATRPDLADLGLPLRELADELCRSTQALALAARSELASDRGRTLLAAIDGSPHADAILVAWARAACGETEPGRWPPGPWGWEAYGTSRG